MWFSLIHCIQMFVWLIFFYELEERHVEVFIFEFNSSTRKEIWALIAWFWATSAPCSKISTYCKASGSIFFIMNIANVIANTWPRSIYNLQLAPIAKTELINIYCHGNTLWARRYIKSKLRAVKPIFQWAYNNAEISGALGVKLFRLFDLSNCKLVAQYITSIWYNFNNTKFNLSHINSALHAISFTYHLFKLD